MVGVSFEVLLQHKLECERLIESCFDGSYQVSDRQAFTGNLGASQGGPSECLVPEVPGSDPPRGVFLNNPGLFSPNVCPLTAKCLQLSFVVMSLRRVIREVIFPANLEAQQEDIFPVNFRR